MPRQAEYSGERRVSRQTTTSGISSGEVEGPEASPLLSCVAIMSRQFAPYFVTGHSVNELCLNTLHGMNIWG